LCWPGPIRHWTKSRGGGQDEARVGQKGRTGYVWWQRRHTPRGLRDVGHRSAWIIGAVCPARDTGVALVMTRLDTAAINLFLAELGQAVAPGAHGIVLMDKAGWHTASDLIIPANLSLAFLPPHFPELNPIERLWLHLRDNRLSTAFSRPLARSSTLVVTLWIGCSAKPDAFNPCVPIPGSNRSAINQASIRPLSAFAPRM
jgi:transposase